MGRVFIINQPRPRQDEGNHYDVSPASTYGELTYVFNPATPAPSRDPAGAVKHARNILDDFDQDRDFILTAGGDPLGFVIASMILGEFELDYVNFLKWERNRDPGGRRNGGHYVVVRVPF